MEIYVRFSDESIAQELKGRSFFEDAPETMILSGEMEQFFGYYDCDMLPYDMMETGEYTEEDEYDDAESVAMFIKSVDPQAFVAYASEPDGSTGISIILWSTGTENDVHSLETGDYIHRSDEEDNCYEGIPVFGADEWFAYAVRLEREQQEFLAELDI